jgi:transposase InsO family protein
MELVRAYNRKGLTIENALEVVMMPHSTYYHVIKSELERPEPRRAGRPASVDTLYWTGDDWRRHPNDMVIAKIKELFNNPLVDYGYLKVTDGLGNQGYWINHKKVYRIMKEERLLRGDRIGRPLEVGVRVQNKMVVPAVPFEYFEMDIKSIYLIGCERIAYVLTIIDVYTRLAMGYYMGLQLSQHAVIGLWRAIIETGLVSTDLEDNRRITIRSDNGSQFIAKSVVTFMEKNDFLHEFTHVASPEENGHIEAFHAIVENAVDGHDFEGLSDLDDFFKTFYQFYNQDRLHSSTCNLSPRNFYLLWDRDLIGERMIRGRKTFYLKIKRYLLKSTIGISEPECSKCPLLSQLPVRKIKTSP